MSTETHCTKREGTAANHCWHNSESQGGSVGKKADGSTFVHARGVVVCCYCGNRRAYEYSTVRPPERHGPHLPGGFSMPFTAHLT